MLTEIVCPNKLFFSKDVDFVILPGVEGDFGVLNHHSPLISNLRSGLIYMYLENKIINIFFIKQGVCQITQNKCIILIQITIRIIQNTESARVLYASSIIHNTEPR